MFLAEESDCGIAAGVTVLSTEVEHQMAVADRLLRIRVSVRAEFWRRGASMFTILTDRQACILIQVGLPSFMRSQH